MDKKFSDMIQVSAKGSLILILGQMGSTLISAIGTILVARMLGSTSFGIISIAQLPVNLALLLINASVSNATIKFIAERRHSGNDEEIRDVIKAGFVLHLLIGLFSTVVLYLLAGYIANQVFKQAELEILIKILSFSVLATAILNSASSVLVGFELMGRRSILWIIFSLSKSIISPALVFLGFGVIGVAFGTSLPILVTAALGLVFVYMITRKIPVSTKNSFKENLRLTFSYSYPLFFSNVLSGSMNQIFSFILPLYVSTSLMGNYSAAATFSVLINFFMTPVSTATFPLLSKLKPNDSVFEFVYQNIIKYESLIVFPIVSMIFASSEHLVNLLYGSSYDTTSLFLKISLLHYLFIGVGSQVTISLLNSQRETKINLYSTLIYIFLGVPTGLILIPRFGVIGFQITTILVSKMGLLYALLWIKRNYHISADYRGSTKTLFSAVVGGALCIIALDLLETNPWIELLTGGIILVIAYLFLILKTGALTRQNVNDIHVLLKNYIGLGSLMDPLFSVLYRISK